MKKCIACGSEILGQSFYLAGYSKPHPNVPDGKLICGDCYKLYFDVNHLRATQKQKMDEEVAKARGPLEQQLRSFHKLFGNLYIKL
jgi:hypothetical protein